MEPKNQVIWTNRCKVMAKYISIYFSKSWFPLVSNQVHQKQKLFREGFALDYVWPSVVTGSSAGTPSKKRFFQKMLFFGDFGFPSIILVKKSLKVLYLSSKMV